MGGQPSVGPAPGPLHSPFYCWARGHGGWAGADGNGRPGSLAPLTLLHEDWRLRRPLLAEALASGRAEPTLVPSPSVDFVRTSKDCAPLSFPAWPESGSDSIWPRWQLPHVSWGQIPPLAEAPGQGLGVASVPSLVPFPASLPPTILPPCLTLGQVLSGKGVGCTPVTCWAGALLGCQARGPGRQEEPEGGQPGAFPEASRPAGASPWDSL